MIPKQGGRITLSDIFKKMETNKKRLGIAQWSISETTLEDVFIDLVTKTKNNVSVGSHVNKVHESAETKAAVKSVTVGVVTPFQE